MVRVCWEWSPRIADAGVSERSERTAVPGEGWSDEELVAALNAGDTRAFDVLYTRYRDWAYRLAWRTVRDEQLAADAVQEAFVYLLRKFPGFELRAKLTTFLYPAVRHCAQGQDRKRRRVSPGGLTDSEGREGAADGGGDPGGERASAVRRAIDGLPPHHREVLLMRAVEGMSVAEVAAALGIPAGTVKSRLHHALASVREDRGLRDQLGLGEGEW